MLQSKKKRDKRQKCVKNLSFDYYFITYMLPLLYHIFLCYFDIYVWYFKYFFFGTTADVLYLLNLYVSVCQNLMVGMKNNTKSRRKNNNNNTNKNLKLQIQTNLSVFSDVHAVCLEAETDKPKHLKVRIQNSRKNDKKKHISLFRNRI